MKTYRILCRTALVSVLALGLALPSFSQTAKRKTVRTAKRNDLDTRNDRRIPDYIYLTAEEMPSFPGGTDALQQYLASQGSKATPTPPTGRTRKVCVQFVVERDGYTSNAEVTRSDDPTLDYDALRTVRSMPQWYPGRHGGDRVRVRISVEIPFSGVDGEDAGVGVHIPVASPYTEHSSDHRVYETVEQMPKYPGGDAALLQYLASHTVYPAEAAENGVQGKVYVGLTVMEDGSVSDAKILRSVDPLLDEEALRVVCSMPRWTPGKKNGQPVAVKMQVPVNFKLQ